jgi:hypothetical protein
MTAGFVATMAFLFGGGISLGAGLWLARYLGEPVPAGTHGSSPTKPPIVLSDLYFGGALANVMLLLVALVTAAVIFYRVRRAKKGYADRMQRSGSPVSYPPVDPTTSDPETTAGLQDLRLRRISSIAWAWACVTDSASRIVAFLAAFAVVDVAGWYAIYVWLRPTAGWLVVVVTACGALTALFMAGFIAVAYQGVPSDRHTSRCGRPMGRHDVLAPSRTSVRTSLLRRTGGTGLARPGPGAHCGIIGGPCDA